MSGCALDDAGLGPLVDALPRNTHLRSLNLDANGMSATFMYGRLWPAVTANASLRELNCGLGSFDAWRLKCIVSERGAETTPSPSSSTSTSD